MSSFHFKLTITILPTLVTPPFVHFPFLTVPSTLEFFFGAESVSTHSHKSRITWPKPHTQHCHWFYWLKQHNTVVNPFPFLISHFGNVDAKLCQCGLKIWLRLRHWQEQFFTIECCTVSRYPTAFTDVILAVIPQWLRSCNSDQKVMSKLTPSTHESAKIFFSSYNFKPTGIFSHLLTLCQMCY